MKWISVKDRLPEDYERRYVVLIKAECIKCDDMDKGISHDDHIHRLDYTRYQYGCAGWSRPDPYLVKWYRDRGDNSWDHCLEPRFCEVGFTHDEITHWLELPAAPGGLDEVD